MIEVIFAATAVITLICAIVTVTSHNVVHALLFMVIIKVGAIACFSIPSTRMGVPLD